MVMPECPVERGASSKRPWHHRPWSQGPQLGNATIPVLLLGNQHPQLISRSIDVLMLSAMSLHRRGNRMGLENEPPIVRGLSPTTTLKLSCGCRRCRGRHPHRGFHDFRDNPRRDLAHHFHCSAWSRSSSRSAYSPSPSPSSRYSPLSARSRSPSSRYSPRSARSFPSR